MVEEAWRVVKVTVPCVGLGRRSKRLSGAPGASTPSGPLKVAVQLVSLVTASLRGLERLTLSFSPSVHLLKRKPS